MSASKVAKIEKPRPNFPLFDPCKIVGGVGVALIS